MEGKGGLGVKLEREGWKGKLEGKVARWRRGGSGGEEPAEEKPDEDEPGEEGRG